MSAMIMTCLSIVAVDGDTLKCDGVSLRPMGDGAPFVSGWDAPEIFKPKCSLEKDLGLLAKRRFAELIATPGLLIEDSGQKDRYGRPLVWLRLPDGKTVGHIMIREGFAQYWPDGAGWCQAN